MHYQIPSTCCIARLMAVMPAQQANPMMMGFAPVLMSFTISVFSPMAPMAMIIRNLLNSFMGVKKSADIWNGPVQMVVIREAAINHRMKKGKALSLGI